MLLGGINDFFNGDIWTHNEMDYVAENLPRFKIAEVLTLAVKRPLERFYRQRNEQVVFYRFNKDSSLFKYFNNNDGKYCEAVRSSLEDKVDSKLSESTTLHFQGFLSKDKEGKQWRNELVAIVGEKNDKKKSDVMDRSIVDILDESNDHIVARAIYEDQQGEGATSGVGKKLYDVTVIQHKLLTSGKYEATKYLEIDFRADKTRRVRIW
jgi:hypothetical protein